MLGFNTRVGMEGNVYYKYKELAKSNVQLLKRVIRIAKEIGREIATAEEARELLNIKPLK